MRLSCGEWPVPALYLLFSPRLQHIPSVLIPSYSQGHYYSSVFPLQANEHGLDPVQVREDAGQSEAATSSSPYTRPLPVPHHQSSSKNEGSTSADQVRLASSQSHDALMSDSGASQSSNSGKQSSSRVNDVSAAGPSNQDPDIPNISSSESRHACESEQSSGLFRDREEGDAAQEIGLTRENIRQLNIQADQGRKQKTRGRGHRRDRVELATYAQSRESSPDEDDRASWGRPRRRPRKPRSRGSLVAFSRAGSVIGSKHEDALDPLLDSSGASSSQSDSHITLDFNLEAERARIQDFFQAKGYLPAPRQTPDAMRRRLRVLRRLGLERSDTEHLALDRFIRLALSVFRVSGASVSVVGRDKEYYLASSKSTRRTISLEESIAAHVIVSAKPECLVISDASRDWRFCKNPLVSNGQGPIRFMAAAPLCVGRGTKASMFGCLSVQDAQPRLFSPEQQAILMDIAECIVNEVSPCQVICSTSDSADLSSSSCTPNKLPSRVQNCIKVSFPSSPRLTTVSVDFLRRFLKVRPNERAGKHSSKSTQSSGSSPGGNTSRGGGAIKNNTNKRISGRDKDQDEIDIDIYDEACSEIRYALDAHAVAVVDLSQFHLFYPAFQGSSIGGSTGKGGTSRSSETRKAHDPNALAAASVKTPSSEKTPPTGMSSTVMPAKTSGGTSEHAASYHHSEESESFQYQRGSRRARQTYALTDPTAPGRTPQVLYIPTGRRTESRSKLSESMRIARGKMDSTEDDVSWTIRIDI